MKLNLGCGSDYHFEWVNVDFYDDSKCDVKHNLEEFPWPWENDSITEIQIVHTLEHLGEDWKVFVKILQEMYRVCEDFADITVRVPSPWHWNYTADPTHVRPIIPDTFSLFSKQYIEEYGKSETPFALIYDVDLRPHHITFVPDIFWQKELNTGRITFEQVLDYHRSYRNVISEFIIPIKVIKSEESDIKFKELNLKEFNEL